MSGSALLACPAAVGAFIRCGAICARQRGERAVSTVAGEGPVYVGRAERGSLDAILDNAVRWRRCPPIYSTVIGAPGTGAAFGRQEEGLGETWNRAV